MATSARIDELRKKFDENPRRYFAPLANEYRKSGDLAQAIFILEEYLPQQQGHISGHIVYGQTLFELGRDEEAKRVFETALSLDPENLIALRHLGHISRQAGDFDAARSWYQRLLEADPRDVEIEQLLGSLDSAAQAQAAEMAGSAAAEPVPPPPAPMAEADDSPLQVERTVEHDGASAESRESTHPLSPPPLAFPSHVTHDAAATPPDSPEPQIPPPLPAAVAEEQHAPEPAHELLDLNDFSFEVPQPGEPTPASHDRSHELYETSDETAGGSLDDELADDIPGDFHAPADAESSWSSAEPAHESPIEATAEESHASDPIPPDVPVGFEPFSGLGSQSSEPEPEHVGGLETYTFEAPKEPVGEASEDVVSFYLDEPYAEPVRPAEGFESVEMEFAADADADPAHAETHAASESHDPDDAERSDDSRSVSEPVGDAGQVEEFAAAATPVSATPVASTPVMASTPVVAASPVSPPAADEEGDAFATETMARLYVTQGHLESALGIYRTLAAKRPDDESLRRQIEEIEDRVQRRRREPTPPVSLDPVSIPSTPTSMPAQTRPVGPTIRDFLLGIIRRGGGSAASSGTPNGGTIDALFGAAEALDDDLVAADTLAQAFAPEPDTGKMRGNPTREAPNELSLDTVFRQPSAAHAGDRASGGFSFDQFFAGERSDDTGTGPGSGEPDDIEQFNAWLNGLKKS